jgi:hypothetical protein
VFLLHNFKNKNIMIYKEIFNKLKNKFSKKKEKKIYTSKNIHNLIINRNKIIGKGIIGKVYSGTVVFKDKITNKITRKKVAIKEFKEGINNEELKRYKEVIKTLSNIKLSIDNRYPNRKIRTSSLIPKMDFIKVNGKWLLVMQSFVKKGKSKFNNNNYFDIISLSKKERNEFLKECSFIITKITEKGYDAIDSLAQFKEKPSSLIPIDLDILAFSKKTTNSLEKAERLIESLSLLNKDFKVGKQYSDLFLAQLFIYSLDHISEKNMKKSFKKIYKKRYKEIIKYGYQIKT